MSKKWSHIQTFGEFTEFAESKGGRVQDEGKLIRVKGKGGGELLITGQPNEPIPPKTKSTLWTWLKIIGLILAFLACRFIFDWSMAGAFFFLLPDPHQDDDDEKPNGGMTLATCVVVSVILTLCGALAIAYWRTH